MAPFWQPYLSFWRQYKLTILVLVAIAALSVGGLYARNLPLDLEIFRAINGGPANATLDALGILGYALGTIGFGILLFGVFFLLGERRFATSGVGAVVAGQLLVLIIKTLTQQPRPWQELAGVRLVGPLDYGAGYPSGHAFQSFLIAYLLIAHFSLGWYAQAGLYALAVFIALTRIYIGEHLPVDVIIGAAIGLLFAVLWVHSRLWPGTHTQELRRS